MKDKNNLLVSVIITTFHNEEYLSRAIESVLHQTYSDIEVIVVDDNPPNSESRRLTERIMQEYPQVIYIQHSENKNGAAARNTGIQAASGEYIAFLDNDDVYFRHHIASCVKALKEHGECIGVVCGVVKVRAGMCWDVIYPPEGDFVKSLLFSETVLGTGSNLFVKTEYVRRVNGFDESFLRHQDIEFGVRIFSEGSPWILKEIQMVKEMDGYSNTPNYDRFLKTKQHFWTKFQWMIKKMTEEEQKRFYAGQYSALLYSACKEGGKENIVKTIADLVSYRDLNRKERILVWLSRMHLFSFYEAIKKILKKIKSVQNYKKILHELDVYDIETLKNMLRGEK